MVDVIIATIGLGFFLENVISIVWGTHMHSVRSPVPGVVDLGPILIPRQSIVILGISLTTVVLLYLFLQHTSFGAAMRATADNRYAAGVIGINTAQVDATTWAVAASVSGVAGVALAPLFGAHFRMGVMTGLKGFAAAVVGGYGNAWGAVAGGLLLGVIEVFGVYVLPSQWRDVLTFAILISFLLLRPTGIFDVEAYDD